MADQLKFLLKFAVLAPSGHNTQPWNFSISGDAISLWVNRERSLAGSDPHRRQLMMAFGCLIENLVIATSHCGMEARIDYFPDNKEPDLVAAITVTGGDTRGNDGDLVSAIPLRHTNRGKYLDRPLPERFLEKIKKYAAGDIAVSVVTDEAKKHRIADIVNDAQIEIMDRPEFREELSHFIKSSFTKEHTGMPGFALEIPAIISLFASQLIRRVNLSRKSRKKDDALLKQHTPGGFIIISSRKNDRLDWLAAGRTFEKIWLTAT
ncbi:MAG TPA: hypothetical protein VMT81_01485, partial [Candidatus Paceibacterota bacterium]|nr:hypothetical protein [Candidatus Paceibacterota bacterium]